MKKQHLKGSGEEKNAAEAVKLFREAADQNYAPAQYQLGICHHNGRGVVKSYAEALKWIRKSTRPLP